MGSAPVLRIDGLVKRYGERVALAGLSLVIPAGQFVALLGPNGAGKSTLFQVLTGIPMRSHAAQALRRIGVVFQQQALDLDLSVRRNLQFQADLQGLPKVLARERIAQGCERFGLAPDLDRAARELSGGNRRKVELIRALLHQPELLLMDEATVGLDPKSRRDLLAGLQAEVRERGASVLWATHWVEEAESAQRVLVLHKGKLLADGAPAAVAQSLGGATLEDAFIKATG
jgi:ABC-2 type transport system ATP-binding protein